MPTRRTKHPRELAALLLLAALVIAPTAALSLLGIESLSSAQASFENEIRLAYTRTADTLISRITAGLDARLAAASAAAAEFAAAPSAASRLALAVERTKITLQDADVENSPLPQGLDLETGEAIPIGADGDMHAFFAAHPDFDLFFDRQLVLFGDGFSAALLPKGTTAATLPSTIPFGYSPASRPQSIKAPGVYMASEHGQSFLAIEPDSRPLYVARKDAAWLLTEITRSENQISFYLEKVK